MASHELMMTSYIANCSIWLVCKLSVSVPESKKQIVSVWPLILPPFIFMTNYIYNILILLITIIDFYWIILERLICVLGLGDKFSVLHYRLIGILQLIYACERRLRYARCKELRTFKDLFLERYQRWLLRNLLFWIFTVNPLNFTEIEVHLLFDRHLLVKSSLRYIIWNN